MEEKKGFFDANKITYELLIERLQEMSGRDLIEATKAVRIESDDTFLKQASLMWQAAVIAYAFDIPVDDVLDLPSKKLSKLGIDVQAFFLSP